MLRQRKALVLTLAAMIVGGCARSDYRTAQNGQGWGNTPPHGARWWNAASAATIADLPEAKEPAILAETHFAAARLFESQGQVAKAITQYRKAVAVNHSYVEAYHGLGLLLSLTGQRDEATDMLHRAVQLKPDNYLLRNNLGFELLLAERWVDADHELSRAVELEPRFARARVNLGIVRSKLGRFQDALANFRAVLPEADAQYNLGLMYRGQKRYAEATKTFRTVLELQPDFVAAQTQLEQMASNVEPDTFFDRMAHEVVATSSTPWLTDPLSREELADAVCWVEEPREVGPWNEAIELSSEAFSWAPDSYDAVDPFAPIASTDEELLFTWEDFESVIEVLENEADCQERELDGARTAVPPALDARKRLVAFTTASPESKGETTTAGLRRVRATPTVAAKGAGRAFEDGVTESFGEAWPTTTASWEESVPASFIDLAEPVSPAVAMEWNQSELAPWPQAGEFSVGSSNPLALMRELEERLSVVRNEIDCLDAIQFDTVREARFARRGYRSPRIRNLGPVLISRDLAGELFGPPAELASARERKAPPTRRLRPARLASDKNTSVNRPLEVRGSKSKTRKPSPTSPSRRIRNQRQKNGKPITSSVPARRLPIRWTPTDNLEDILNVIFDDAAAGRTGQRRAEPITSSRYYGDRGPVELSRCPLFVTDTRPPANSQ